MSSKMQGGGGRKGSKKDGVGGGLVCAHCKKVGEFDTMKRCGRCRRVCYCSVECQKLHWKRGGHKKVCGKEGGRGTSNDGAGGSGGVDAHLQHPCPICLDCEDDAGEQPGMCYSCGQIFCGSCKTSIGEHGVTNCPICRAPLAASVTEQVRLMHQLASRSNGRHTRIVQYNLGVHYAEGSGVAQDDAEAVRWYRLAADHLHVDAQYNIAVCYQHGTGVAQDEAEAARWYLLAAAQGEVTAQYTVGVIYLMGTAVPQDFGEGARWLRLAADQGHAEAQYHLGVSYQDGKGVPQDSTEAMRWYRLSADQGFAAAQHGVGVCYLKGIGVVANPAQGGPWIRLAADQGYADALTAIAHIPRHLYSEFGL